MLSAAQLCTVRSRKARSLVLIACALVLVVICCFRQGNVRHNRQNERLRPGLEIKAKGRKEDSDRSKFAIRSLSSKSEHDTSGESYQSEDHYSTNLLDDDYSTDIQWRTYITPLFSSEQMMNTLASFVDLCRISVDWNASLVEPHICGSRLYGLPGLRDHWCPGSEKMYPYRTFYDLEQLNGALACTKPRRCGMAPYEEFLQYSHRQLVILHALSPTQFNHFSNLTKMNEGSRPAQSTLVQCNEAYPSLAVRVADSLNARTKNRNLSHFRTPMLLCWNKVETVTTQSVLAAINSFMEPYNQNRFSVLFTTYSARQPEPGHDSFRERFASDAVVGRVCQPRMLHSASSLRVLANAFLRDMGLKRGRFVSVHVSLCIHAYVNVVMSSKVNPINEQKTTNAAVLPIPERVIYSEFNTFRQDFLLQ